MNPTRNNLAIKILLLLVMASTFARGSGLSQYGEYGPVQDLPAYREKLFLHCDRKVYLTGETIWFKGYCVHRNFNIPVDLSRVMYVEVVNERNTAILSEKVGLSDGTGHGSIYIPRSIQTGTYYLRAYTRWMANSPPEYYFLDRIYIVNPFFPVETIREQAGSREYTMKFFVPDNRLVAGQQNDVAFRAVDRTGRGIRLEGWVVDAQADTLASFSTYGYGFGMMSLVPRAGERLRIRSVSQDGTRKEFPFSFQVVQGLPGERGDPDKGGGTGDIKEPGRKFTVSVEQDRSVYGTREKVVLSLRTTGPDGQAVSGNLSVAVYKSDEQVQLYHKNIYQYLYRTSCLGGPLPLPDDQLPFREYDSDTINQILDLICASYDEAERDDAFPAGYSPFPPESRGIMVTGRVLDRQGGEPAPGVRVFMAKPGRATQLYNVASGEDGRFYMQVINQYGSSDIILMPEKEPGQYRIVLDDEFSPKFAILQPSRFLPGERTVRYLEGLMVNLQIGDAFGMDLPPGDEPSLQESSSIFGEPDETVLMADYIQLPAIEELFFELVNTVLIKRRKDSFSLSVLDPATNRLLLGEPLLLLDGVPIFDIDPVITYMDPVDIDRIEVLSSWYILGDKFYSSVINMITQQADFSHVELPAYAIRKHYDFLQYPVSFTTPDHSVSTDTSGMIPDYRNLLYWNPEVITDARGRAELSFYTSDDISDFRIVIQGLTQDGAAGYKEAGFSVSNR
jgi:hypothetical protein